MAEQKIEIEFDYEKFIEELRKRCGESTRDIAAQTGISASTWSRVGNGMSPDMATFLQVCSRFDLTPGD